MRVRAALGVLGLALAVGCGGSDDPAPAPAAGGGATAGSHVHGLGVNPKDGSLLVATHSGLFRAPAGASRAARVGRGYTDTMGFTVTGPDRFVRSGHPDAEGMRNGLPPYLGLMESPNAGRTWRTMSLLGKADFHALAAEGRVIYGSGSDWDTRTPRFLASDDGGRSWQRRTPPEPLISIAVDPADADRVLASGERGLYASDDAGRRWRPIDGPPGLVAFAGPGRPFLVDFDGRVRGGDGRARWAPAGDVGGQPAAFAAASEKELYVALRDGAIKRSSDAGRTWTARAKV